jgi:hypothetical protein
VSTSPSSNQHPRFGFTSQLLIDQVLTDSSLVGASKVRLAGLFEVSVVAVCTAFVGVAQVNLIVEGSNDNANWFLVAQLTAATYFTTTGQKVLNPTAEQIVSLERFQYVRVRSAIVAGAPTFSMQVFVAGIQGDSESFVDTKSFTRTAGTVTQVTPNIRPAGVSFVNVQIDTAGLNLGGAASIQVALQGSPNYETGMVPANQVWQDLVTTSVTANGAAMMSISGDRLIDLAGYDWFRIELRDVGGVSVAYAIDTYVSMDSGDWIFATLNIPSGGGSIPGLDTGLLSVQFSAPGVEAANTIIVPFQVLDSNGNPVTASVRVEFIVYDTANAGDLDLAATATFSAVGGGASAISGIATNRVAVDTSATGIGTLSILDAAVETVYLTGVQPNTPIARQIVWEAGQATLVYA